MSVPDEVPIDVNNPSVRDYLNLVRLQVLTPLSVLVSIATVLVATTIVFPGLGAISKTHPTPISASPNVLGIYFLVLFACLIGYCCILVMASEEDTKVTLTHGVGFSLVVANWLLAGWAVAWALQWWISSTILLSLLTAVLLYSNVLLLIYHPPSRERPLDTLFIHAPMRLFLLLSATLLLPMSIFIMTGKTWDPIHADHRYSDYQWEGLAVILITNAVGWIIVILCRDIFWCIGAMWINICILAEQPKSFPVEAAAIAFTVLQPLAFVGVGTWKLYKRNREGAIRLPQDEEGAAVPPAAPNASNDAHERNIGRVWG
ncbi:hypothetical protein M422DRAFT_72208 [Sphaerobolus stellatus SS14]|uniref:Uncharacterized protein n=1 Tax=Sphaerobolus stellatus (strain SS14) TaxID=990650 RepID=A0A0C9UJ59_SPHS4|nr:hypothetical protein M422DRAFT_72208 [Sphaerobolus stellatus SS14]